MAALDKRLKAFEALVKKIPFSNFRLKLEHEGVSCKGLTEKNRDDFVAELVKVVKEKVENDPMFNNSEGPMDDVEGDDLSIDLDWKQTAMTQKEFEDMWDDMHKAAPERYKKRPASYRLPPAPQYKNKPITKKDWDEWK